MATKGEQLQIRVTARQKAALKRRASAAGMDVSTYVLSRALPTDEHRFGALVHAVSTDTDHRFALAALNDFLTVCPPMAFAHAVRGDAVLLRSLSALTPRLQNYVAAMVEQAAHVKDVPPPPWVRDIAALTMPHFAATLRGLRPHLLAAAPVAFKRRNLFVDASIGDRV